MPIKETGIIEEKGTVTIPRYEYDVLKRRSTVLDFILDCYGKKSWELADMVAAARRILFGGSDEATVEEGDDNA